MEERLQELGVHTKDTLGAVQVTAKGDRFCIKIPEEGSVFVHEQMKGREFIQDLVELVGRHGCSLDEIRELFLKWSEHAVFEEIEDGDFDSAWAIGAVLLVLVLAINLAARLAKTKLKQKL